MFGYFIYQIYPTWIIITNRFSDNPFHIKETWIAVSTGSDELVVLGEPDRDHVSPQGPGHGVSTAMI